MKKVGIKNFDLFYFTNSASLKSDFFYFDEILFDPILLEELRPFAKIISTSMCDQSGNLFNAKSNEIEFLVNNGLLKEFGRVGFYNYEKYKEFKSSKTLSVIFDEGERLTKERNQLLDLFFEKQQFDKLEHLFWNLTNIADNHSILLSFISNFQHKDSTVPIIFNNRNLEFINTEKSSSVLNIVLSKFPSLDKSIEWNQVKEIKTDNVLRNKYLKLNNFINELSHKEFSIKEIEEKIEYLIREYENQLLLHNKKLKYNKYELVLNSSIGILENLIKGNILNIGKNILDIKKEKVGLEIEKQFLNGNEIAFISEVSQLTSSYQTPYNNG